MRYLSDLLGTLQTSFRIKRATFDASGLSVDRSLILPNKSGTLAVTSDLERVIGISIDGGGSPITSGVKGYLVAGFSGTIVGWDIVADVPGSIVMDVWRSNAGAIPSLADTITGTEKPTLSSAQISSDLTLSTWSTQVVKGQVLGFNVDSAGTVTKITLTIRLTV